MHLPRKAFALVTTLLAACALTFGAAPAPSNPNAPINEAAYPAKIKVACVGDSITLGAGTTPRGNLPNAYPTQLQRMLGDSKYEIKKFASSGRTLMSAGDRPFIKEKEFTQSLEYKPDVVIIMLGTNDTKSEPNNWTHKANFGTDYKALVSKYLALEPKPRVFVCRTCFVRDDGFGTINEPAIAEQLPIIDAMAKEMNLGLINIHDVMKENAALIGDKVHPNSEGAQLLAKTVYKTLTGKEYTGPTTIVGTTPPAPRPTPATTPPASQPAAR